MGGGLIYYRKFVWLFYPKISCFIKQVCKSQANLSMGFTYAVAMFRSHAILSVQQFSTMSDTAIRSRAYIQRQASIRSHAILSVQQFSTMSDTAIRSRAYIQRQASINNQSLDDLFTSVHTQTIP